MRYKSRVDFSARAEPGPDCPVRLHRDSFASLFAHVQPDFAYWSEADSGARRPRTRAGGKPPTMGRHERESGGERPQVHGRVRVLLEGNGLAVLQRPDVGKRRLPVVRSVRSAADGVRLSDASKCLVTGGLLQRSRMSAPGSLARGESIQAPEGGVAYREVKRSPCRNGECDLTGRGADRCDPMPGRRDARHRPGPEHVRFPSRDPKRQPRT